MKFSTLTDLDELLLSVRSRESRIYAEEAIRAHRSGLNRAALISLWVAVVFDILSKLRELANRGDSNANVKVLELDNAIDNKNVVKLQEIESKILDVAQNDFEFISARERIDLERLQKDRHVCAHPAFTGEAVLFTPSPEVVRSHIVHSITFLMQHPPTQGKAALVRLKADLIQASFPVEQGDVYEYLNGRYLDHAKDSFLTSAITVLLKVLLRKDDAELLGKEQTLCYSLMAISNRHPGLYEERMRDEIPRLIDGAEDEHLTNLFKLIGTDARVWQWLDEPTQLRVREMVRTIRSPGVGDIFDDTLKPTHSEIFHAFAIPALRDDIIEAFSNMNDIEKENLISTTPRPEFADDAVRIYADAGSFRSAENLGWKVLLPSAEHMSADQIKRVLHAIKNNGQISYASKTPEIIVAFFEKTSDHHSDMKVEWQAVMEHLSSQQDSPNHRYAYPALREKLESKGWWPIPPEECSIEETSETSPVEEAISDEQLVEEQPPE